MQNASKARCRSIRLTAAEWHQMVNLYERGNGPAGGTESELEQMIIQAFENGRIVRIYALSDELSFWRTIGAELPA